MRLLPTKQQWSCWSLPSRLTAIGCYLGAIAIILSLVLYLLSPTTQIGTLNVYETAQARSSRINERWEFMSGPTRVTIEQMAGAFDIDYVKVNTTDHQAAIMAEYAWARAKYPHHRVVSQALIVRMKDGSFKFLAALDPPPNSALQPFDWAKDQKHATSYCDLLILTHMDAKKWICFDITQAINLEASVTNQADALRYISEHFK